VPKYPGADLAKIRENGVRNSLGIKRFRGACCKGLLLKTGILAGLALVISVSSAAACAKLHPANFAVFKQADVIIRAKITSYESETPQSSYFAHFNFATVETLLGPRNVRSWSARLAA
jgi:hypothetical protein